MSEFEVKVPDQRQEFSTGAHRGGHKGQGRYDLIPWDMMERFAIHLEKGAEKHGDRNWERGMPLSSAIDSALHHLFVYLKGDREEDHLAAVIFNMCVAIRVEALARENPSLVDLPAEIPSWGHPLRCRCPKCRKEPTDAD